MSWLSQVGKLVGIPEVKIREKDAITTLKKLGLLENLKKSLEKWIKERALNISDAKIKEFSEKLSDEEGINIPAPIIEILLHRFEKEIQEYAIKELDDYLK